MWSMCACCAATGHTMSPQNGHISFVLFAISKTRKTMDMDVDHPAQPPPAAPQQARCVMQREDGSRCSNTAQGRHHNNLYFIWPIANDVPMPTPEQPNLPVCQRCFMRDKNRRPDKVDVAAAMTVERKRCIGCNTTCTFLAPQAESIGDAVAWIHLPGLQGADAQTDDRVRVPFWSTLCSRTMAMRAEPPTARSRTSYMCLTCLGSSGVHIPSQYPKVLGSCCAVQDQAAAASTLLARAHAQITQRDLKSKTQQEDEEALCAQMATMGTLINSMLLTMFKEHRADIRERPEAILEHLPAPARVFFDSLGVQTDVERCFLASYTLQLAAPRSAPALLESVAVAQGTPGVPFLFEFLCSANIVTRSRGNQLRKQGKERKLWIESPGLLKNVGSNLSIDTADNIDVMPESTGGDDHADKTKTNKGLHQIANTNFDFSKLADGRPLLSKREPPSRSKPEEYLGRAAVDEFSKKISNLVETSNQKLQDHKQLLSEIRAANAEHAAPADALVVKVTTMGSTDAVPTSTDGVRKSIEDILAAREAGHKTIVQDQAIWKLAHIVRKEDDLSDVSLYPGTLTKHWGAEGEKDQN